MKVRTARDGETEFVGEVPIAFFVGRSCDHGGVPRAPTGRSPRIPGSRSSVASSPGCASEATPPAFAIAATTSATPGRSAERMRDDRCRAGGRTRHVDRRRSPPPPVRQRRVDGRRSGRSRLASPRGASRRRWRRSSACSRRAISRIAFDAGKPRSLEKAIELHILGVEEIARARGRRARRRRRSSRCRSRAAYRARRPLPAPPPARRPYRGR